MSIGLGLTRKENYISRNSVYLTLSTRVILIRIGASRVHLDYMVASFISESFVCFCVSHFYNCVIQSLERGNNREVPSQFFHFLKTSST